MSRFITIQVLLDSFARNFPGLVPERGPTLNGEIAGIEVWEFVLVGSVTVKYSGVLVSSVAHLTFQQKTRMDKLEAHNYRLVTRGSLTTEYSDEMEAFIQNVAAEVLGVQAAIEMAFMEPEPKGLWGK